ncbi:hypothetical protein [Streptococcus thermophilus]|nr:hypothetical protein [Streptococcus thermophilus]MDW2957296.1 hypothetical protein [Streptococcus thermophilus]
MSYFQDKKSQRPKKLPYVPNGKKNLKVISTITIQAVFGVI